VYSSPKTPSISLTFLNYSSAQIEDDSPLFSLKFLIGLKAAEAIFSKDIYLTSVKALSLM